MTRDPRKLVRGGLAIRAAAGDPRVAHVIADDIFTDFLACNLRQLPAGAGVAVRLLMRLRAGRLLDALVHRRMRHDLLAAWGAALGKHVLGVSSPHEYLAALVRFVTGDVSSRVRAVGPRRNPRQPSLYQAEPSP